MDRAHQDKELDRMECINVESAPHVDKFYYQEDKCDMGGCAGKQFYHIKKRYFHSDLVL